LKMFLENFCTIWNPSLKKTSEHFNSLENMVPVN
jgi:hypothetical protein